MDDEANDWLTELETIVTPYASVHRIKRGAILDFVRPGALGLSQYGVLFISGGRTLYVPMIRDQWIERRARFYERQIKIRDELTRKTDPVG